MQFRLSFLLFLAVVGCTEPRSETLRIATAANMQFAMQALTKAFSDESKIPCEIIISSSGKLTAQIKEGAPYDVFVSANMKYPNELAANGLTTKAPVIYAYGQLILWTNKNIPQLAPAYLRHSDVKHIALANPKTAPYGQAAMEVLAHYNLTDSLKNKLVYGESIAQTNQFILSAAADVGFTAKSVVHAPQVKGKGHWVDVDPSIYAPIQQGIVVLKKAAHAKAALSFENFLLSTKGKKILKDFGYSVIE